MSPWLSNSAVTMDLLQEAGYRYVMDWTMDDQPIWIRTRKGRILAVPYPIEVNDTRGIVWYRYTVGRVRRHDRRPVRRDARAVGAASRSCARSRSTPSSSAGPTGSAGCAGRCSTSCGTATACG